MIRIYMSRRHGTPLMSAMMLLTSSLVTIATYFTNDLYYIFATQSKPFFVWQYCSGIFEHSILPTWFLLPHFIGNMSMIVLLCVPVERLLGTGKTVLLAATAVLSHVLYIQTAYGSRNYQIAGASVVTYAFALPAVYMAYAYFKSSRKPFHRDFLFYLLALELIFIWGYITATSSWEGTNVHHLIATAAGAVFTAAFRKDIGGEVEAIISKDCGKGCGRQSRLRCLWAVPPLCAILIMAAYAGGRLDGMFLEPVSVTDHDTVHDVALSGNIIKISFAEPIGEFDWIRTSGYDKTEISYGEDRKTVYCRFPEGIHHAGEITLISALGGDGKCVRKVRIKINE